MQTTTNNAPKGKKSTSKVSNNENVAPVAPVAPVEIGNEDNEPTNAPMQPTNDEPKLSATTIATSAEISKDQHKSLTPDVLTDLANELLNKYGSVKKINSSDVFQPLLQKYGKDNAKAIVKQCKAMKIERINKGYKSVYTEFNDYKRALASEYNRLKQTNGFGEFTSLVANTWTTAEEFISNCYPYVIDGNPAHKVTYISKDKKVLVETFETCDLQGKNATSYLLACLTCIKRNATQVIKKAKDNEKPTISNSYTSGVIVSAYDVIKTNDNKIVDKGDKITNARLATIISKGLTDYEKLSEYRKDNKVK